MSFNINISMFSAFLKMGIMSLIIFSLLQNVLREEIKEKLKWGVDRSSPSNKIRDFMDWARSILIDIRRQRKIMANPIALPLSQGW